QACRAECALAVRLMWHTKVCQRFQRAGIEPLRRVLPCFDVSNDQPERRIVQNEEVVVEGTRGAYLSRKVDRPQRGYVRIADNEQRQVSRMWSGQKNPWPTIHIVQIFQQDVGSDLARRHHATQILQTILAGQNDVASALGIERRVSTTLDVPEHHASGVNARNRIDNGWWRANGNIAATGTECDAHTAV